MRGFWAAVALIGFGVFLTLALPVIYPISINLNNRLTGQIPAAVPGLTAADVGKQLDEKLDPLATRVGSLETEIGKKADVNQVNKALEDTQDNITEQVVAPAIKKLETGLAEVGATATAAKTAAEAAESHATRVETRVAATESTLQTHGAQLTKLEGMDSKLDQLIQANIKKSEGETPDQPETAAADPVTPPAATPASDRGLTIKDFLQMCTREGLARLRKYDSTGNGLNWLLTVNADVRQGFLDDCVVIKYEETPPRDEPAPTRTREANYERSPGVIVEPPPDDPAPAYQEVDQSDTFAPEPPAYASTGWNEKYWRPDSNVRCPAFGTRRFFQLNGPQPPGGRYAEHVPGRPCGGWAVDNKRYCPKLGSPQFLRDNPMPRDGRRWVMVAQVPGKPCGGWYTPD